MTQEAWLVFLLFLGAAAYCRSIQDKPARGWVFLGLALLWMAATGDGYVQWYRLALAIFGVISLGKSFVSFTLSRKHLRLGQAVLSGDLSSVRDLLQSGANPNLATLVTGGRDLRRGRGTPLMAAAAQGSTEIVNILVKSGARVNDIDERGWSALFFAAENGHRNTCKKLLDLSADPNARTRQGGTPLMAAALKGHADVVRLLIEEGVDLTAQDSAGKSALDFARKYGHRDVIDALEGRESVRPERSRQEWDIFVSYKSEDVAIVRVVAEQLMARGVKVWFAEYKILLRDRDQFADEIEQAIANCKFAVCFTNDRFTTSPHCRREVELLLDRLGPERIIEIALPREPSPHRLFPELALAQRMEIPLDEYSRGDHSESGAYRSIVLPCCTIDSILEHIHKCTALPIAGCNSETPPPPQRRFYRSRGIRYSLDFAGWNVKRPGILARLITWGDGDTLRAMFSRQLPGGKCWGHLIVGKQDVPRKRVRSGTDDDREYYDVALEFARGFYEDISKQSCTGVHLVFLEGFSHPAFTTLGGTTTTRVWSRLYSVAMKGRSKRSPDIEFAFFFFFSGDFSSFVRSAHIADRLVLSLRVE